MRIFVPDLLEFFSWLDKSGHRYAVLRRFYEFDKRYPNIAPDHEIDMLADDSALPVIQARYATHKKGEGVECDIYNVSGGAGGGEYGIPYYPPTMAEAILAKRRIWKNRFYVPDAEMHLISLLYHMCYRRAEASGFPFSESAEAPPPPHMKNKSKNQAQLVSKYSDELGALKAELHLAFPNTLESFHHYLTRANYSIPYAYLMPMLQDQFRRHVKSYFMARVVSEQRGELNLFVIRAVAMQKKMEQTLIDELKKHYTILAVKPISWWTRLRTRNEMRGGKWKRGGWPNLAIVVYDPHPQPSTEADRKTHPYVFNNRQFFKPALREWFTQQTGADPKANPLHSTDNEAEALGHLNLFFTPEEQTEIISKVTALRQSS